MVSTIVGGIVDADTVVSVTFEYSEVFGATGGSLGSYYQLYQSIVGRSSEQSISQSAMLSVEAAVSYSSEFSPVSGSIEASASYEWSGVSDVAQSQTDTTTVELSISLAEERHVYQKGVTIHYANGESDYIGMGTVTSTEPIDMRITVDGCKLFVQED